MKHILFILFAGVSVTATAQTSTDSTTHSRVNDEKTTVQFTCATCTGKSKLTISGNGISITQERDKGKLFPLEQQLAPGDYRYMYWQNGVLQMQLPFTVKAGEKNIVNVK